MGANSDIKDFDIVIVGGGLAGISMAAALRDLSSDRALHIAIIEAVPFNFPEHPSFDDRALALSYGSKCIFQTLGLWSFLANSATPIKHIHVSDQGHAGFLRMHAEEADVDALGYVVTARDLGLALNKYNQCPTISTISPAQVEQIAVGQDSAELLINIEGNNIPQKLTTKLVVLADGGRSGLAQQLGVQSMSHDYQQQAILANVQCNQTHRNIAYERFTANGPVALLPMQADTYKLVCTVPVQQQDEIMALSDERFLGYIQQWFGDRVGQFIKIGKRATYPMTETSVDNIAMHRLALIGNAAHAMHPIAGQGFNLGLRDAAALAELVNTAVRRQQDIGSQQLLNTYKQNRLEDIQSMSKLTDSLVHFFSNAIVPVALLRNIGLLMVDRMPFLKKQLMRKMMGLSGRQGKLMRGILLAGDVPISNTQVNKQQANSEIQHVKS